MKLRPYQEEALAFMVARDRAILGDPPGVGKTPVAITALRRAGARRILLVVPKAVIHHWEALAAAWWPELQVVDGTGSAAQRERARGVVGSGTGGPAALLVNYEAMRGDVKHLVRIRFDTFLADEAHRLKNRQALQTKAAWQLAGRAQRAWLLTGTPIVNRPDEAWSLLHLLDPKGYSSFWAWVGRHMLTDLAHFGRARRPTRIIVGLKRGAEDRIRAELAQVLIQRDLDQLLPDLPPVTITPTEVDLDAEERRAYTDLVRRHWTQLEDGTVVQTVNEVSRITRLRQIVSDMEALSAGRAKPGSKIVATLSLIGDLEDEQVVVLTWSRAAAERIAVELGKAKPAIAATYIHGGVTGPERQGRLDTFRKGKVRVLAGTLGTLGEGVDGLQVARHLVLLDRPWRPSEEDQAIGRLRRSGQTDAVFVWPVTARNTIDQAINKLLAEKRSVIDALKVGGIQP